MPIFGPSARYSPGGPGGGGEAPPGGSAKRRMSGAERQGGDLLTPWKYSARQRISSTYLRRAVVSTALEKSRPRFGPSARYSPGGRRGGGEAPPGGSAKRRMSGAERQGGDLLTPWKYSARQRISSTYLRRAALSTALEQFIPAFGPRGR